MTNNLYAAPNNDPDRDLAALQERLDIALSALAGGNMPDLKDFDTHLNVLCSGIIASHKTEHNGVHFIPTLSDLLDKLSRLSYGISRLQAETLATIKALTPQADSLR